MNLGTDILTLNPEPSKLMPRRKPPLPPLTKNAVLIGDSEASNHSQIKLMLNRLGYNLAGIITTSAKKEFESVKLRIRDLRPDMIVLSMECQAQNGGHIMDNLDKIPPYTKYVRPLAGRNDKYHYVWEPTSTPTALPS